MTNPTQADRKLATDISFFCVEREIIDGEITVKFNHKKALDMIAQHVQDAVKAETEKLNKTIAELEDDLSQEKNGADY